MRRRITWILAVVGLLTIAVSGRGAAADAGGTGRRGVDGLGQTEAAQQQLRATTGRVGEQLSVIIEEFARSGLAGEDVQLLTAIRGLLGRLTDEDMVHVVTLLQQAREGSDAKARLFEAFSTQKTVGLKLRQILLEYQRQQELAGVAARLEELAARQNAALRETMALAASSGGRKREWLTENQRIALQLQVSEQQSLRDETLSVLQRLRAWSGSADNDAAARAQEALETGGTGELAKGLDSALADLNGGHLMSATGRQRATRSWMRGLARRLAPPSDELEALQAAVRNLDGWLARQESVRGETRLVAGKAGDVARTVQRQVELLDEVDDAQREVVELDATAGEQVASAASRMQEARGVLEVGEGDLRARRMTASTHQELATARLGTARRLLQERIDTLEKQRASAADPLANLQQVRADVAELLKREVELKQDAAKVEADPARLRPLAPRQGDLGDRAGDASARAALDSEEAGSLIAEATRQMRVAQRSLGEGKNNEGAEQAAVDGLSKALEVLDAKLAELAKAREELAELDKLLQRLIALIESQQRLNGETARAVRKLPGRTPREMGVEQTQLNEATRTLSGELPASVPQAVTYLEDAATQMILAANELGASRAAEARPPEEEALANLQRARRELEERMAQLKEMLGEPPDGAALEQLAQAIKLAQQDVTSAQAADATPSMAKGLSNAGRRIQPATSGRMGRMPRAIREALQRADQSLTEGMAEAEAGNQAGAQNEAADAQGALAAAAAALDLAMAGMGQQPGAGEGQGGQGNKQGQGQGKGRGKTPGSQSGKGTGDAGNFFGAGGADGPKRGTTGNGRFIGLPARERAALLQSQGERYPQEYAPMIEQYLKNLSDQTEAPAK